MPKFLTLVVQNDTKTKTRHFKSINIYIFKTIATTLIFTTSRVNKRFNKQNSMTFLQGKTYLDMTDKIDKMTYKEGHDRL